MSFLRTSRAVLLAAACTLPLAACGGGDTAARQKEAEAIAAGIESYLGLIEDKAAPAGLRHDKVTVTPETGDGKGYAVAITGIKFADQKGAGLQVGEIDYRLTPGDKDTFEVSDLKLPAELPVLDEAGKPVAKVALETTAFTALWSTPLQNFLKLDWQAKNLAITATDRPDLVAKADSLAVVTGGTDNGKGLLNQVTDMTISGVTVMEPTEGVKFTLAKLAGKVGFDDFDFPAYRTQMLKLRSLTEKFAPKLAQEAEGVETGDTTPPATPASPAPTMTDEDRKALAEVVAALPKTMSGYSYGLTATGLSVTAKDGTTPVRFAEAGTEIALKGVNTEKATLSLGVHHDGLELAGPEFEDPMLKAVLPKSGNLALTATDLPVATMVDAIAKQIPALTGADPAAAQGAQFALMGAFMQALSQSTIKLKIEPSHLTAEKAAVTADGELKLAMSSPTMAVGAVNFALTGLDDLAALAGGLAQQSPSAAEAVGFLQMLQTLAKRETGADGKPVDKFKVDMTPTGAVLVNDKPLDGLMP